MSRAPRIAIALLLALTGACGSVRPTVQSAQRMQLDPGSCVTEIKQIPATALHTGVAAEDWKFQVFAFQQLASCARAADGSLVPMAVFATDGRVPVEIRVILMVDAQIAFAAAVDLLDAEHQLLRTIPFTDFSRRGASYTGSVFLNEQEQQVRYLVLRPDSASVGTAHSSTSGIGRQVPYVIPIPGGIIYGSVATGSEKILSTWLSEVGSFSIAAREYAPTEFGSKPARAKRAGSR